MTMLDFAHHIIAVANTENVAITNLQLQKVMYFSLKEALLTGTLDKEKAEELYDKPFEVWRYGPVVRDIYELYKPNGASSIIEEHEVNHAYENLNSIITKYLEKDPFKLVKKSHEEKFWAVNEQYITGWRSLVTYGIDDIIGSVG